MTTLIKCGHCKNGHPSVADARACAQHSEEAEAKSFLGLNKPEAATPPTERQLNYAHVLLNKHEPFGLVSDAERTSGIDAAHEYINGMDRNSIGEFIGQMQRQPTRNARPARTQSAGIVEGMYRRDGIVYKVQRAVHGSGHLYAKILQGTTFTVAPGAISALRPEHQMTLDDAKEYGRLYGVCCRCGRTLTDESSIAAGIGPVCSGKDGWA